MARGDGDRLVRCGQGHIHWGRFGAAGLLAVHGGPDGHVLLQQRAAWTPGGNTWGTFGGARDSHEDAVAAALRETAEESTLDAGLVRPFGVVREDHGSWSYDTVIGSVDTLLPVGAASAETRDAAWVPVSEVDRRPLFAPFAEAWPRLVPCLRRPVLVVDAANVMGSRPDGWWRDRKGAAARLRDSLAPLATSGVPGFGPFHVAYPEILLVVEGQARGIGPVADIGVVDAPGSGDDTIAALAAEHSERATCLVVTADRELRGRCEATGARVLGPRWLLAHLS